MQVLIPSILISPTVGAKKRVADVRLADVLLTATSVGYLASRVGVGNGHCFPNSFARDQYKFVPVLCLDDSH